MTVLCHVGRLYGASSAEVGDEVVVLFSGTTPFILRVKVVWVARRKLIVMAVVGIWLGAVISTA